MSKHKAVYIEWLDSVGIGGWQHNTRPGSMKIISLGILVEETDKFITISTSNQDDSFESPLSIPKVAITKRRNVPWPGRPQ